MPSKKPWQGSTRRKRLPNDWPNRRKAAIERAGGRCECTGWCGKHDGRCRNPGNEADHAGEVDDHDDLQALCHRCHAVKTAKEARIGNAWRYARFDNSEPHPGAPPA